MKPLVLIAMSSLLAACAGAPLGPSTSADAQFAALEHDYVVELLSRYPVVATSLGGSVLDPRLAEVDGQLRDYAQAAIESEDTVLMALRRRFVALDPGQLSPARRIDRAVALAQVEFLLHAHARHTAQRVLDSYVDEPFRGIDWQLQGLTPTGPSSYGTEAEWRRVIARCSHVRGYLKTARDQLAAGIAAGNTPDWRMIRANGLQSTQANAEYFSRELPEIAQQRMGPQLALLGDLKTACADAATGYRELRAFVETQYVADSRRDDERFVKPAFRGDRYQAGEAEYNWALKNNLRVDKSAAELYEQAWPIVQNTRTQMVGLARQIGAARNLKLPAGDDAAVRAVMDVLSGDAPKDDAEMLDWYREAGVRLVEFARQTGLFDVPADYRLDVVETPPPLRASFDGAAYYGPPPFKHTGVGRFYLTPTGNDPAKLATQNRASVADLAAHEGFPGHDWHYKVLGQYTDQIGLIRWLTPGAVEDSSSMWEDSMAAEGWALYAEALVKDFYTPEEHLYQLQNQLLRDLRVRIDTGLHTGRLGYDAAVDLFSQVVDFQPGSCFDRKLLKKNPGKRASCEDAGKAIFRYSRWPTQAITYRLGKDAILALRSEAEQRLGSRFDAKTFHVEFMKQGTIPSGYFREELLAALQAR